MSTVNQTPGVSASEAILKLKHGNQQYLNASFGKGDISPEIRRGTYERGQHPYAIIISCSDSRLIPECIFSAGIGDKAHV